MKKIKDFENYSIDENGNVFNTKGVQIKPSLNNKGYLRLSLRRNGIRYYFSVHRLVAMNYLINEKNLLQVNHLDGNKQNNHYSNLEWCTNKQNVKHAIDTGLADYKRDTKGTRNGNSKLTDKEVSIIKTSSKRNIDLAKEYKVSSMLISLIKRGKRW